MKLIKVAILYFSMISTHAMSNPDIEHKWWVLSSGSYAARLGDLNVPIDELLWISEGIMHTQRIEHTDHTLRKKKLKWLEEGLLALESGQNIELYLLNPYTLIASCDVPSGKKNFTYYDLNHFPKDNDYDSASFLDSLTNKMWVVQSDSSGLTFIFLDELKLSQARVPSSERMALTYHLNEEKITSDLGIRRIISFERSWDFTIMEDVALFKWKGKSNSDPERMEIIDENSTVESYHRAYLKQMKVLVVRGISSSHLSITELGDDGNFLTQHFKS